MRWGAGFGCYWGDPDVEVIILDVQDLVSGAMVTFVKPAGYAEFVQLVIDGVNSGPPVYVKEGQIKTLRGNYALKQKPHYISVVGVGPWAMPDFFDVSAVQAAFINARANRINMQILATPELFSVGDSAQLSAWAITGVQRFTNCRAQANRPTWGETDLKLVTVAGTHTLTLALGGNAVASGSRVGDGSITLTAQNNSGISGTVTLTYSGDFTTGGLFVAAFPASYFIYYRSSGPWMAGQFGNPTAKVFDDGHSGAFAFESPVLATNTYYCVVHEVNENKEESAGTTNATQIIVYVPAAPGLPVYASGNWSNTTVNFAASTDGASTYNIYDSADTGIVQAIIAGTHIAGAGTLSQVLPAISNTFTGVRYVLIRSLLAGIESTNSISMQITYVNGVVTVVRPPAPAMVNMSTVGRALTVKWSLDTFQETVVATSIKLFVATTPTGFNYAAPIATLAIAAPSSTIMFGTITGSAGGDGEYYFALRADSAAGQSLNVNYYGPVKLSTALPGDPIFSVSGGI